MTAGLPSTADAPLQRSELAKSANCRRMQCNKPREQLVSSSLDHLIGGREWKPPRRSTRPCHRRCSSSFVACTLLDVLFETVMLQLQLDIARGSR